MLYEIRDPNRRIHPQFTECIIVTTDGQLTNGHLIAESYDSVTLPRPEGIEKNVSIEQMVDLLAFLKNR